MIALMVATVVHPSLTAAQVLCLLAALVFLICMIWSLATRAFYSALLAFALLLFALGALWGFAAVVPPGG